MSTTDISVDLSAETQGTSSEAGESSSSSSVPAAAVGKGARKKLKAEGRKKRTLKLKTDATYAKQFFESKSKRSAEKKSAFRKKKTKKK